MSEILIYSKTNCVYCEKAKRFLDSKNIKYKVEMMDDKPDELAKLKQQTGHMTVPQIFVNGIFLGGYTELVEADSTGKLKQLLSE